MSDQWGMDREEARLAPAPLWEQVPTPRGATFDHHQDGPRLGRQYAAVEGLMSDGEWRTLRQIAEATGAPEASASARLRDLRRAAWTVEHRREGGTWWYRAIRGGVEQKGGDSGK